MRKASIIASVFLLISIFGTAASSQESPIILYPTDDAFIRLAAPNPISLAVDASGTPHISYYSRGTLNLAYLTIKDNEWDVEEADHVGNVGLSSSLALDAEGKPHISYIDWDNVSVKYARKVGTEWYPVHVATSVPPNECWYPTSIAIDASGAPHISYYTASSSLGYAVKPVGSDCWVFKEVDDNGDVGRYCSIAIDAQGNPHISYWDATNNKLKYAVRRRTGWEPITIDNSLTVGMYTSIALHYR